MVFPYMDHDLAGLLENSQVKLEPQIIKSYAKQMLCGLEYLHDVSIVTSNGLEKNYTSRYENGKSFN